MPSNDELIKIIKAQRTGQPEEFLSGVREIIIKERKQGHFRIADELEKALYISQQEKFEVKELSRMPSSPFSAKAIPLSKGDQFPLLEVRNPEISFSEIVLSDKSKESIFEVLTEHRHRYKLNEYGMQPISRLLFYGPPGCGKTLAAHIIANELGCPLFYVRFDSVISSYLGETSSNLRRIFEYATNGLSVLFFDEFDAIGKSRDIKEDIGELKRVVNSFLQMMDNYQGKSVIITATNHENLLDSAIWRRFEKVIVFSLPDNIEIEKTLILRLKGVSKRDFYEKDIAALFQGLTYHDITKICHMSIKAMILNGSTQLNKDVVINSLESYKENRPVL